MKGSLFRWFLFISFTHAISSVALSSSSNVEDQDFDPSKPIMQGIQVQALNRTIGLYPEGDDGREHKGKHIRFESIKAQKGKGTYGGANIVHRRPNEKNAASLIARPPLFITMILTFFACKLHCYSCFSLP